MGDELFYTMWFVNTWYPHIIITENLIVIALLLVIACRGR